MASHFGDPDGKYVSWLKSKNAVYPGEAWFFWNQVTCGWIGLRNECSTVANIAAERLRHRCSSR